MRAPGVPSPNGSTASEPITTMGRHDEKVRILRPNSTGQLKNMGGFYVESPRTTGPSVLRQRSSPVNLKAHALALRLSRLETSEEDKVVDRRESASEGI